MRITSKEIFTEDNQGQVLIQTAGTTRLTVDGTGGITTTGTLALGGTVSGITATSASLKGTIQVGGASDLVGFFGTTPVAVQATTATTGTFAAGAGTAAVSGSSWVGNTGTKAYTVSDVVSALKAYGILSA